MTWKRGEGFSESDEGMVAFLTHSPDVTPQVHFPMHELLAIPPTEPKGENWTVKVWIQQDGKPHLEMEKPCLVHCSNRLSRLPWLNQGSFKPRQFRDWPGRLVGRVDQKGGA
jgi:hypothetical protein